MAHTADMFLVDAQGMLRAQFPFGTSAAPMIEAVRALLAEDPVASGAPIAAGQSAAPATAAPVASPATAAPASPPSSAAQLLPEIVSTSIWAEPGNPVLMRVVDSNGTRLDGSVPLSVQLMQTDGTPVGGPVTASALRPVGARQHVFVAPMDVPSPGAWKLRVTAGEATGDVGIDVLDPATRCQSAVWHRTSTRRRWTTSVVWCAP